MTANHDIPDPAKAWSAWRDRIYRAYGAGVAVSVTGAFVESFHGLIEWFRHNQFAGIYAFIAPVMIDVFILGGESLLLIAVLEKWDRRAKAAGWLATITGLSVSIYGNAGRNGWHDRTGHLLPLTQMLANAAAPAAMTGLLALALLIIKRHFKPAPTPAHSGVPDDMLVAIAAFRPELDAAVPVSIRAIRERIGCGQDRATRIARHLTVLAPAFNPAAVTDGSQQQEVIR